jgi:hypothetical protein
MPFDPLLVAEQTDIERAPSKCSSMTYPIGPTQRPRTPLLDLTNLVFLGNRSELLQAFAAAGWALADGRDAATDEDGTGSGTKPGLCGSSCFRALTGRKATQARLRKDPEQRQQAPSSSRLANRRNLERPNRVDRGSNPRYRP